MERAIPRAAMALAVAGWVIALVHFRPVGSANAKLAAHGICGTVVMVLGLLQPLNAVVRPHKGAQRRLLWEVVHKGSGWTALVLAVGTVGLGISIFSDQEKVAFPNAAAYFNAAYAAAWGIIAIMLVGFALDTRFNSATARAPRAKAARQVASAKVVEAFAGDV